MAAAIRVLIVDDHEIVHAHVGSILGKPHVASRTQAALYALKEGIATLDDVPQNG